MRFVSTNLGSFFVPFCLDTKQAPEEEERDFQLCVDLWQRPHSSKHLSHQSVRTTQGGVDLGANTCAHIINPRYQVVLYHLPQFACHISPFTWPCHSVNWLKFLTTKALFLSRQLQSVVILQTLLFPVSFLLQKKLLLHGSRKQKLNPFDFSNAGLSLQRCWRVKHAFSAISSMTKCTSECTAAPTATENDKTQ